MFSKNPPNLIDPFFYVQKEKLKHLFKYIVYNSVNITDMGKGSFFLPFSFFSSFVSL